MPTNSVCSVCEKTFAHAVGRRSKYCSRACYKNISARFWSKVERADGCWLWRGTRDNRGYGVFRKEGKDIKAHRYMYEITYGVIPDGLFVCHTCDNPPCVRPDHLWAGTPRENTEDRDRKGRWRAPDNPVHVSGEQHGMSRLTWALVREIRQRFQSGGVSKRGLAREFHVHPKTVREVLSGARWKE